jgi:hypothetical protein
MARTAPLSVALLIAWTLPASGQSPLAEHRDACERGELISCTIIGLIYETGAGGVRDVERAISLYERACRFDVAAACTRLELAQRGVPTPQDGGASRIGRVADEWTGAPIGDAVVDLPDLGIRVLADAAGRADLGSLPPGRHRIVAQRFGYERVEGDLPVPWETEFLLLMAPTADEGEATLGRIFGQVTEEGTGRGLSDVEVTLVSGGAGRTVTNSDGRFGLAGLEPGTVEVRLFRLGYEVRTTTLTVRPGRTVEIYATLSAQAIELEAIEVVIGSPYLERTGFYLRARGSAGSLFTRRDFDRFNPIAVSDIFARAPGVSVLRGRRGAELVTRRDLDRTSGTACRLMPYLDGIRMTDWDLDNIRPDDLEAIEIYTGPDTPVEFANRYDANGDYQCGVVLIWTTRGG